MKHEKIGYTRWSAPFLVVGEMNILQSRWTYSTSCTHRAGWARLRRHGSYLACHDCEGTSHLPDTWVHAGWRIPNWVTGNYD